MKIILSLLFFIVCINASELSKKYAIYTEYLGMETLKLNETQLRAIVPKLEKLMKDKEVRKILLENRLNQTFSHQIEQTICFSSTKGVLATVGDDIALSGGECKGRVLAQMNQDGWKLTQILGGLQGSFGMVFTREK